MPDIPNNDQDEESPANAVASQLLLKQAVTNGLNAAKKNRLPGIALWLFGSAIIAGYYLVPSIHDYLERVGELKIRWGLGFSAVSTGVCGGLIPSLIRKAVNRRQTRQEKTFVISNTIFWAIKGVEVDLFYRVQAVVFGEGTDWQTIATKTFVDQIIYVPIFGLVNVILFYHWRDCHYDLMAFRQMLGRHWYRSRVLPVLIANWLIWIPAVVLIYCFPLALQLPVQNLILCFWVLMLTLLTAMPAKK